MLQFLQRIGKAVMLPIAALPIAGILLGVGGAFLGIAGLENAPAIYQPLLAFISIPAIFSNSSKAFTSCFVVVGDFNSNVSDIIALAIKIASVFSISWPNCLNSSNNIVDVQPYGFAV